MASKTTTRATKKPTRSRVAKATTSPAPDVSQDSLPKAKVDAPKVKRSEFVARVAERAELRPNQVKPVLEAVLAELGVLLVKGETLSHPALGKLSVNRTKESGKADVVVCKLRRPKPELQTTPLDPVATAAE